MNITVEWCDMKLQAEISDLLVNEVKGDLINSLKGILTGSGSATLDTIMSIIEERAELWELP